MITWLKCFLCNGYGRIDVGKNHNPFNKPKNILCPICKGIGKIVIKEKSDLNKDRKDYL